MIFSVQGEKIRTLVLTDEKMRFSSRAFGSEGEFDEAWGKQWTTATTFQIKFDAIRRITKEDEEDKILIRYRSYFGLPSEVDFSFSYAVQYVDFFYYLEKQQYFTKIHERMRPWRAALPYIVGFVFSTLATVIFYRLAVAIKKGTAQAPTDGKTILVHRLIRLLGENGTLVIGVGISGYLLYKVWKRYTNPPNRTKMVRL